MIRLSLTTRLSLMFMVAVVAVLAVAALSFTALSRHHFELLDRQALLEKLEATRQLMAQMPPNEPISALAPRLRTLLGAHPDLSVLLLAADGSTVLAIPEATPTPADYRQRPEDHPWDWQREGRLYRVLKARVSPTGQPAPTSAVLMLDVTTHMHFFQQLHRWFWIGLTLSALISAGLGWLVARNGLRPVRQVTRLAASMSARALKERIPLEPVPHELRDLVSAFNAMLARLDDAFGRLSNFSTDIAHELRTPVSNLMTHTEVVLSHARGREAYEDTLYANLDEFRRMARTIDDMLFLAKSENGLAMPSRADIDLGPLVLKLFEYYQLLADERGIRLTLEGAGQLSGDRLMLERALSNLLSNALRYTADGQAIRVLITRTAKDLQLTVENPGEAIAPGQLERLFERFYRIDAAPHTAASRHVGLGLAITRAIVEAHGGTVRCLSSEGYTRFQMTFSG
ncbi:MAG: heavy metal sensor histidine kinase [Pseudomonas sp.]|uniref:heavy metal sensor histidine kinase n=1 Tax=Pseudomonas sp. TaxID=306 RepID=UPI003391569E